MQIAERLRASFQDVGVMVDGHAIGATVSSGLATSRQPEPDIGSLLVLADTALYRAKNEGRNRFCCADENPDTSLADAAADAALEAVLAERKPTPRPAQAAQEGQQEGQEGQGPKWRWRAETALRSCLP